MKLDDWRFWFTIPYSIKISLAEGGDVKQIFTHQRRSSFSSLSFFFQLHFLLGSWKERKQVMIQIFQISLRSPIFYLRNTLETFKKIMLCWKILLILILCSLRKIKMSHNKIWRENCAFSSSSWIFISVDGERASEAIFFSHQVSQPKE